ncbi:MAG TPA: diguanylate cyclase [Kofleriaceae bacterium]|nr:diguanylate cyclase [Kofleriaceae bacterium]
MLVVDGDPGSRSEVAGILAGLVDGMVQVVGTVEEGLAAVREATASGSGRRFDVVLLDLELWTEGGPRLCRAVREADPKSSIPIVVLVAFTTENLIDAALQAGATDLMYRPIRPRELAARVHAAMAARREREERSRRERRLAEISRELIDTNRHLERLVCVDSLTGLANRRHLGTILGGEWRRAVRTGGEISVLMIDLDEFHAYNETWGHPGGDTCLRRVSEALAGQLRRPSDLLGRYGGEEFLAVLPDTGPEGAALVAERLRAVVHGLGLPHPRSPHRVVTVSIGAATDRAQSSRAPDDIIAAADRALYLAKQAGRNCVSADGLVRAPEAARQRTPTGSDRWPSPVWIDPVYADRVPAAIDHMRRSTATMREALAAGDHARVSSLAADLRASAAQYGLDAVVRILVALDDARGGGDTAAASHLLGELAWYLERVPVVYRTTADLYRPGHRLSS